MVLFAVTFHAKLEYFLLYSGGARLYELLVLQATCLTTLNERPMRQTQHSINPSDIHMLYGALRV